MGEPMAASLIRAGFAVAVCAHRNRAPVERLVAAGATDAGDPESIPSGPGLGTVQQAFAQLTAIERAVKRAQEKQAIEDIMRVSAWWGYDMANLGFKTRPTPVVEWTEDGRPLIQYAKGEPGGGGQHPGAARRGRREPASHGQQAGAGNP